MTARKIRMLSVTAAAVALITTLALARNGHTPVTRAGDASVVHGNVTVTGSNPNWGNGSHLHGIMTCGATVSATECENLNTLLPMSWDRPDNTSGRPVNI